MNEAELIKLVKDAVRSGNIDILKSASGKLKGDSQILLKTVILGMEEARKDLMDEKISLPEFLLSVDTFREGLKIMGKNKDECETEDKPTILIGLAEGEVHDLGKNIVSAVLEASGFKIIDLGHDVTRDAIFEGIKTLEPDLLGLSAMMSTCIPGMQETVSWIKRIYPDIRIIVGGAAMDADIAVSIGAHGFAWNASGAVEEAFRLIGS